MGGIVEDLRKREEGRAKNAERWTVGGGGEDAAEEEQE
jgi:hypothetical protein